MPRALCQRPRSFAALLAAALWLGVVAASVAQPAAPAGGAATVTPEAALTAGIAETVLPNGLQVVTKEDLNLLGRVEEREAQKRGLPSFKFSDDSVMLQAIEAERGKAASACAGVNN